MRTMTCKCGRFTSTGSDSAPRCIVCATCETPVGGGHPIPHDWEERIEMSAEPGTDGVHRFVRRLFCRRCAGGMVLPIYAPESVRAPDADDIERGAGLLQATAAEYEDSARACDTPALAVFRRSREERAAALRGLSTRLTDWLRAPLYARDVS